MTQQDLWNKYKSDLKELQDTCQHEKVSDWMMYDDGGFPRWCGRDTRVCERCAKIIEERRSILFAKFITECQVTKQPTISVTVAKGETQ